MKPTASSVHRVSRQIAALTAVALSLFSLASEAQTPDPMALLRSGVALRREGNESQAFIVFQQAWELGHSPIARAQMGLVQQALGRWLDAERFLREAITTRDVAWVESNRAVLSEAYNSVISHLGRLELSGGIPGSVVRIEGEEKGILPLEIPLWLEGGRFVLEVTARGYYPYARTVEVHNGETGHLEIVQRKLVPILDVPGDLPGAERGIDPERPAVTDGSGPRRMAGSVLLVAGGLTTVGTVIAGAVREVTATTLALNCQGIEPTMINQAFCDGVFISANAAHALTVAGVVVSSVAVISGTLLLAIPGRKPDSANRVSVRVLPSVPTALFSGISLQGTF